MDNFDEERDSEFVAPITLQVISVVLCGRDSTSGRETVFGSAEWSLRGGRVGVLVNEIRRTDKFDLALQNEATVVARQNVCSYRTRVIVPAQTAAGTPTSTANTAWKAITDITLEVYAGSVKQNWAVFVWGGCALTGMESFSGDYRTRTGRGGHAALGPAGRVRRGKGISNLKSMNLKVGVTTAWPGGSTRESLFPLAAFPAAARAGGVRMRRGISDLKFLNLKMPAGIALPGASRGRNFIPVDLAEFRRPLL